jgi:hypothetical protein
MKEQTNRDGWENVQSMIDYIVLTVFVFLNERYGEIKAEKKKEG